MKMTPLTVICPCGAEIDIPLSATLTFDYHNRQHLNFNPDYTDLWAHSWTHNTTVYYAFGPDVTP